MRSTSFDRLATGGRNAVLAALALLPAWPVLAHSPHDIISDIAIEQSGDGEGQAFIVVTDQLFRSDDRNSPWKNLDNGLDIQHSFTALAMSPRYGSDDTIYVATSGDGVFRSLDGGDSWHRINSGLAAPSIARLLTGPDNGDAHYLLAAGENGGLWRYTAADDTWRQVLSGTVQVTALSRVSGANDGSEVVLGDAAGRVWRAYDDGRLWEIMARLDGAGGISGIAAAGSEVFVGTEQGGVYKIAKSSNTLRHVSSFAPERTRNCLGQPLESPVADSHVTSITLSPAYEKDGTLFVTTWYNAVHVSNDRGESWSMWHEGLSCNRQADTENLPHFSKIAIEVPADGPPIFWLAAFDGLFRSANRGSEWDQLETLPLGMIKGFAVHHGEEQQSIVALATYGGGFYLTRDLGRTWTIGNQGLLTTRLTGITFSRDFPEDGSIFAGADQQLLVSTDGGRSWNSVMLQEYGIGARIAFKLMDWGAPMGAANVFYDPEDHPRVYPTHIVTQGPPRQHRVLFATRFTGVMSYDRGSGETDTVWAGTSRIMNTFVRSPQFETDNTLFASIRGEGLVRSRDAGATWMQINDGLQFVDEWMRDEEGSNFRRDVQLAISPAFDSDRTLFAGSPASSGLYFSADQGDSWQRTALLAGETGVPVLAIAVSPDFARDDTVIVSVKGHGLFRSQDRGKSFEPTGRDLLRQNASIEYLEFSADYAVNSLVLAASDEELFVSRDRGETWRPVDRPVRYEDLRGVVRFSGEWRQERASTFSAMTETVTTSPGASVRLRFLGTGVRWIGSIGPEGGRADVYVDGELVSTVNSRAPDTANMEVLYATQGLEYGLHTLEVVKRPGEDKGGVIAVDAFDVLADRQGEK